MYLVVDRITGAQLNSSQILIEVNRDRSESWDSFTLEDLEASPHDVLGWLSPDFYSITNC